MTLSVLSFFLSFLFPSTKAKRKLKNNRKSLFFLCFLFAFVSILSFSFFFSSILSVICYSYSYCWLTIEFFFFHSELLSFSFFIFWIIFLVLYFVCISLLLLPIEQGYCLFSGRNYCRSSVMTNQISKLTEQSFLEICGNERSQNEIIWTPKCDRLPVFDMVEKMKREKSVNWIFSLHGTKTFRKHSLIS